jgi:5-methylcytosine-specific restriction endonuclease McrA
VLTRRAYPDALRVLADVMRRVPKAKRTPPCAMHQTWTEAQFWAFVRSGLRAKWVRWPPRYEALRNARRAVKGQRHKWEHKCAKCKRWYKQKDVQVDHITPVGTLKRYADLDGFVRRLFVSAAALRILCKSCHNKITQKARLQAD